MREDKCDDDEDQRSSNQERARCNESETHAGRRESGDRAGAAKRRQDGDIREPVISRYADCASAPVVPRASTPLVSRATGVSPAGTNSFGAAPSTGCGRMFSRARDRPNPPARTRTNTRSGTVFFDVLVSFARERTLTGCMRRVEPPGFAPKLVFAGGTPERRRARRQRSSSQHAPSLP